MNDIMINIGLLVIIVITSVLLSNYNKFVRLNNKVSETSSTIDILLNQRFDLIPNIVEVVKGYTKHESSTFEELASLRSSNNHFSIDDNEVIDKKFNTVMAVVENYPELKANTQFLSLQNRLSEIENKLNMARISYNRSVTRYNNLVQSIPSNIVAKIFNFTEKELFKLEENKRENIKINL